jgi:hypothetical protein
VGLAKPVVFSRRLRTTLKKSCREKQSKIREPPKEEQPLGQAHSPAIELSRKIAHLAGLFRPTAQSGFQDLAQRDSRRYRKTPYLYAYVVEFSG